jgi:tRNA pseudouridine32 synthase/23S rRNA pseudouridine746 synthase
VTAAAGADRLRVLFQDAHLLAVDKPPGRLVIPGRRGGERSLREDAEELCGRIWVVHRLDRGTSGLLVFARTAEAHRALNLAFDRQEVEKTYLAVVLGSPEAEWRVDIPIAPARRGRMRPARPGDPRGKPAATRFRVLERIAARPPLPALALVEATPETGRTHQIRVHLAQAHLPLAFDPDYGGSEPLRDEGGAILLDRTPLHAARLALGHPATSERLALESPLPADMASLLAAARGEVPRSGTLAERP